VQVPDEEQESTVHPTPSSQSLAPQQARQPTPEQQRVPAPQPAVVHWPFTQEGVMQGSSEWQSEEDEHWVAVTQPRAGSQTCPESHVPGRCEQLPDAHESTVQPIPSLQSAAEQHVPHVADAPSALVQHCSPAPQSAVCWHPPAVHVSLVHGLVSSQLESTQHVAQPLSGQQSIPLSQ
jgi:hypothetical protein